jgi:hypothetical protein
MIPFGTFDRPSIANFGLRSPFYRLCDRPSITFDPPAIGVCSIPPIPPKAIEAAFGPWGPGGLPSLRKKEQAKGNPCIALLLHGSLITRKSKTFDRIAGGSKRGQSVCRPLDRSPQNITCYRCPATDPADTVQTRADVLPRNAYFAALLTLGPMMTDHGKRFSPARAWPRRTPVKPNRRAQCECSFLDGPGKMTRVVGGGRRFRSSWRLSTLNRLARAGSGKFRRPVCQILECVAPQCGFRFFGAVRRLEK